MSVSEWRETNLDEVLSFYNGKKRPTESGNIPVYGGNGILSYCNSYNTEGESLIIGRVGAYCGNVFYENKKCWISDNAILAKAKTNVSCKFMYYILKHTNLNDMHIGSSQPLLTQGILKGLTTTMPRFAEQKAIAATLSALDDMIELNNQINKTLEEMAQAIFKSWFVDFEPFKNGEFEESELGLIPKGWEVIELRDIVDTFNGYSYKGSDLNEESKDALFTIKNFQRDGGFKTDGFKGLQISERVKPFHYLHRFDLIVAHTDITQAADIIGNPILILSNGNYKNLIMSMDLVKVVSKKPKINNFILYMLLKDERFKAHAIGYSSGTTVLHLNKKAIPDYKVALPKDMDIIEKITVIFESIYKEVSRIYEENRIIKEIRDTLLPKLISGEIRVPVEEVV